MRPVWLGGVMRMIVLLMGRVVSVLMGMLMDVLVGVLLLVFMAVRMLVFVRMLVGVRLLGHRSSPDR